MSSIKYILIQFSYLPEGHSERLYYSLIKIVYISYAGVESSIFSILKVEWSLIVHGRTQRLRTGKRVKVVGNLQYVSSYQGQILHTLRVECIVG